MTTFCGHCREVIGPDDRKREIPGFTCDGPVVVPYHNECFIRRIVGGLNHQQGRCTCCGGDSPPDPPWMTTRDAARAAINYWMGRQ